MANLLMTRRNTPRISFIGFGEAGQAIASGLRDEGIAVRCVSMPSWDLFEAQPKAYRDEVLPPDAVKRLAVDEFRRAQRP